MGYVTTQFHNLKARFVFDIRSLTISIWKSPRQWLKFNFYNWLHWQIGAVEIMWHRLPSRRPTKHAPDVVESAASVSIFPASEVPASEADSTPATTQVM